MGEHAQVCKSEISLWILFITREFHLRRTDKRQKETERGKYTLSILLSLSFSLLWVSKHLYFFCLSVREPAYRLCAALRFCVHPINCLFVSRKWPKKFQRLFWLNWSFLNIYYSLTFHLGWNSLSATYIYKYINTDKVIFLQQGTTSLWRFVSLTWNILAHCWH